MRLVSERQLGVAVLFGKVNGDLVSCRVVSSVCY